MSSWHQGRNSNFLMHPVIHSRIAFSETLVINRIYFKFAGVKQIRLFYMRRITCTIFTTKTGALVAATLKQSMARFKHQHL